MVNLDLVEIQRILDWMKESGTKEVIIKQSGSSGIGISTEVVDREGVVLFNATNYDMW